MQDVPAGGEGQQSRPARGVQGGEGGLVGDVVQDGADPADLAAGGDPGALARARLIEVRDYIKRNGCWPIQPVLPTDADFLQGAVNAMNSVIRQQTTAHGGTYIDLVTPSAGHDACQSASKRWIEGYVPVNLAAPLHPNARGEAAYANIIHGALNA
ncbi:GDSL-type esterase/lipase family protein [Actinomadura sp. 3N407]|uniref:GDSL-type esterase/lipase family protein n=1 Tax=Actinomadura sp. 3N407 TaxID=3457423 RepID=UPI003FCCB82A